jgi:hypothetical protein
MAWCADSTGQTEEAMIWICLMGNMPVEIDGTGVDGYYRNILIEALEAWMI